MGVLLTGGAGAIGKGSPGMLRTHWTQHSFAGMSSALAGVQRGAPELRVLLHLVLWSTLT